MSGERRRVSPGVIFETPPLGSVQITLVVSDGELETTSVVQITFADRTAPDVFADLVSVKSGPSDGIFVVAFSSSDAYAQTTDAVAYLNGAEVVNGQEVKLKIDPTYAEKVFRKDGLFLLGPDFQLTVTCTDLTGNAADASATPVFKTK